MSIHDYSDVYTPQFYQCTVLYIIANDSFTHKKFLISYRPLEYLPFFANVLGIPPISHAYLQGNSFLYAKIPVLLHQPNLVLSLCFYLFTYFSISHMRHHSESESYSEYIILIDSIQHRTIKYQLCYDTLISGQYYVCLPQLFYIVICYLL